MARRKSIAVPEHMLPDGDLVNQRQGHDETIVLLRINNWLTHGIKPDGVVYAFETDAPEAYA